MSVKPDFLEGAIDLHVHSAPDVDPGATTIWSSPAKLGCRHGRHPHQVASELHRGTGLAGVASSHRHQGFWGLVLNETVGGLNVSAVKLALAMGAKEIWMPTRSALNHRLYHGETGGISVLDANGALVPAAHAILEAVAERMAFSAPVT